MLWGVDRKTFFKTSNRVSCFLKTALENCEQDSGRPSRTERKLGKTAEEAHDQDS